MKEYLYLLRRKSLIVLSVILLLISAILLIIKNKSLTDNNYNISFKQINTNNIALAKVAIKKGSPAKVIPTLSLLDAPTTNTNINTFTPSTITTTNSQQTVMQVAKKTWYLPTEQGVVTQNPRYGHVALDITSPRGTSEAIYPVADGVISGIYTDMYGALIVTIAHYIDGKYYTSQYVHLSSYAYGIYVGKPVTIYDKIGQMGSTGYSTGVHLHIAVMDCYLFNPNDSSCSSLGGFYNYASYRYSQGFGGLQNLITVPYRWYSR